MPVYYDVTIKFVNRTNKVIKNVSDFGPNNDCNYFYVVKNGYKIFIPRENVLYIGREFDLREESNYYRQEHQRCRTTPYPKR